MRWILVITLFFAGLGAFPVGQEQSLPPSSTSVPVDVQTEYLDVFQFDFSDLLPAEARVRTSSSSSQRLKNERSSYVFELPGLIFLHCKVAKSYSEIHIEKYLKLLIQYTIQVNAP
jgi:hypothetical protein